jgi:urease accessory protein
MRLAEPVAASWKASLSLRFARIDAATRLTEKKSDGPLLVQKPLYPEGSDVCHAIVVHPPGGIAGGDELCLEVGCEGHALLTTPGAAKWYRSAGPWARQHLRFDVAERLEWLPRETIVYDRALAELECEVRLGPRARYIGWEIVCLGRTGSGERFQRGTLKMDTRVYAGERLAWVERGTLHGGDPLMRSDVGLGGRSVFGTMVATNVDASVLPACREIAAVTLLPGLMVARYLGDSTEETFRRFVGLWKILRPHVMARDATTPRIWRT